jgi:hypothetical protein
MGCCEAAGLVCGWMSVDGGCVGGGEGKDEAVGELVSTVAIQWKALLVYEDLVL